MAAVVDLVIALASGEHGLGAFVEPGVIVLILVANGAPQHSDARCLAWLQAAAVYVWEASKVVPANP